MLAQLWARWLIVIMVVSTVLGFAQSTAGQSLLASAGLKPKPNHYVALSFTDVSALPYSAVTGSRQFYSITIENHEGTTVLYRVEATGTGSTIAKGSGAVIVPDHSSRVVNIHVALSCVPQESVAPTVAPTARIVFELKPSHYSLTHSVYCRARS